MEPKFPEYSGTVLLVTEWPTSWQIQFEKKSFYPKGHQGALY